jgi:aspartate-semialdehyde dehydrogenase
MKVAVVGATGLVGSRMIDLLAERSFPVTSLIPVASPGSIGKSISFQGQSYPIVSPEDAVSLKPDLALFSAGGEVSLKWAPIFANEGIRVIDNSSAWRMNPAIKLVIPEINAHVIGSDDYIIANPNCSTIQMLVALHPLHQRYRVEQLIVSTYQSVTGTGVAAVRQLMSERKGEVPEQPAYPYPIDMNIIPQIDVFTENGYTKEEMKMVNETKKIWQQADIMVTATTVRIPVMGGHSESLYVAFKEEIDLQEVRNLLQHSPGIRLKDQPESLQYPMPIDAEGNDWVWVGRVRKDLNNACALNMWVVSDNLRKGAATNAIQIAEYLIKQPFLSETIS